MMKSLYLMIILGCIVLGIRAQEITTSVVDSTVTTTDRVVTPVLAPSLSDSFYGDSLHLPVLTRFGQMPTLGMYPYLWGSYGNWDLHRGLNMNLGASVFTSFGKNAYHGTGFEQDITLMYAQPVTDHLSLAIGGYLNNLYWAHDTYRSAGLNAVLGYRFDEHWEAYLYAQKALVKPSGIRHGFWGRGMPLPLYDIGNIGDRIGFAVKYNFSPSFSVQLNVEKHDYGY